MASFTRGSNVVLDETAGLQNATASVGVDGDAGDNDILLTSSEPFSTPFSVLSAFGSVARTALSGYTGATGNTGSNAFTVSPGTGAAITDVGFVGPDGQPLNGLDSGLFTVDGLKIFLYTGANNNVVLGRVGASGVADPAGPVAFAGYIEETLTAGAITGGKIWLTEYLALRHPVTTNPDDPLNLDGKVFVGVSQDANFSLSGAPSGQQLFLMFTTAGATTTPDENGRIPGVSIIVTGKDPLNQSQSSDAITSADTVNSSQGGGNTTLGTNNQAITEQEGLRFTFVTGAKADVTIPNLSPGEAGIESNIDFTQYFGARSATFQVVQETGGTTAMVRLTAFRNADNVGGSQSGVNFIDSYANDANEKVAITAGSVTVTTFAGAAIPGVVITYNADGSVLLTGVPTDSQVMYRTSSDHNRVLVENAGSLTAKNGDKTHADFDIGGFKVLQTSTDRLEIGSQMVFEDDGPSVTVARGAAAEAVTVDETTLATDATANYADNFTSTPDFGTDGAATSGSATSAFALGVGTAGGDTGLDDVATGSNVVVFLESGAVVGRVANDQGAVVFRVTVSAAGVVTLDQQRAVVHPNATNPDDSVTPSATNLITLTRTDTVTDRDGDTYTGSATIDITSALTFKDDGPSVSVRTVGTADGLAVDETVLATNATADYADNFANTPNFGADGQGTTPVSSAFALAVGSDNDSGLDDVATGSNVLLYIDGQDVVGRVGSATGAIVFRVSVSTAGVVTLDQQRAVVHPNTANPDDAVTPTGSNKITLTRTDTITDKDGDTNTGSATIDLTPVLSFEDDGPAVAFGNLVGTGTDRTQYGSFTTAAGADGPSTTSDLQIALTGFTLNGAAQAAGSFSLTRTSANNWTGTLTGDFNNDGTPDASPLTFTLVAQADGNYALKLATPVQSTTVTDTATGALGAGGPDAVQTLNIPASTTGPAETVVFFSAKIDSNASAAAIAAGVIAGATDPTEANLQGANPPTTLAAFIDPRSMNVSTAGIGVDNNLMNGYGASGANAIIDDPDGTGNTPADDSFVVNPLALVDKVRVFVDNSVTGYDYTGGERLQYRVVYGDNTVSPYTTVEGNLGKGTAPKFFEIDGGGKKIDAVQLTMLYGEIKIPNIQFVTLNEGLAKDIGLLFSATVTDKDGDTATDAFSADLFTNKAASATFDYELLGTLNVPETFDVELPSARDDYRITGFDTTTGARDRIALLGAAVPADQRDIVIANGPGAADDSIVTIKENGTTTATLTVVGVDVAASDFVFL